MADRLSLGFRRRIPLERDGRRHFRPPWTCSARRHCPRPQPVRGSGRGIRNGSRQHFLSVRQLPVPIELAGTFFPADGYALLQQRETISLVSKTRYSHSCGWLDGREIRKDIPDPAPSSAEAMAWHIEAKRCNWIGEFISGSMLPERRAILAAGMSLIAGTINAARFPGGTSAVALC